MIKRLILYALHSEYGLTANSDMFLKVPAFLESTPCVLNEPNPAYLEELLSIKLHFLQQMLYMASFVPSVERPD